MFIQVCFDLVCMAGFWMYGLGVVHSCNEACSISIDFVFEVNFFQDNKTNSIFNIFYGNSMVTGKVGNSQSSNSAASKNDFSASGFILSIFVNVLLDPASEVGS